MTGALPDPVRRRVLAMAAEALGELEGDAVPGPLKPFARFTPARRARRASGVLATALESDPGFRDRVAEWAGSRWPQLAAAVTEGDLPPTADPVEVAALAYLLRAPGWEGAVAQAGESARAAARASEHEEHERQVGRLREQLDAARAEARRRADRHRVELAAAREEVRALERRLREQGHVVKLAERTSRQAAEELAGERERAATAASAYEAEARRLRQRATDLEVALENARRAGRQGRNVDDARLWLLLDTVVSATQGLRRELALSPTDERPADAVAASVPTRTDGPGGSVDDPARLDQLLALPRAHLVIDGYNVTKTGYGDLPLESQRTRLIARLAGLAAQSGAEVTVVFDGAERLPVTPATPRGVRVLFSPPGEIADELIRRLVRAEPPGRPVVVVSSDREVADGVRRHGAYAVPSLALLQRLQRS